MIGGRLSMENHQIKLGILTLMLETYSTYWVHKENKGEGAALSTAGRWSRSSGSWDVSIPTRIKSYDGDISIPTRAYNLISYCLNAWAHKPLFVDMHKR